MSDLSLSKDGHALSIEATFEGTMAKPTVPFPDCLLGSLTQLEVNQLQHRGPHGWKIEGGLVTEFDFNLPYGHKNARNVCVVICRPRIPNQVFSTRAGQDRETLVHNAGHEVEELECDECGAWIEIEDGPPTACPACGESTGAVMPTVGELAERYGADAVIEPHPGYASINLDIVFTRTQEQADKLNTERHAERKGTREVYKTQKEAWDTLVAPIVQAREQEKEAKERAQFEELRQKFEP